MSTTVALIGAAGHGLWHRRAIASLGERVRLVALCDVRPVDDAPVPQYRDHRELLERHRPEVVVIVTPPHTHLPIALDALAAGADVLLEKPPVLSLGEHATLLAAARGRACQVGFQALASPTLAALPAAVGTVTAVAVAGAWWRPDAYWKRSPWAGRRFVDGQPTMDGALVNPFAHGLMQALAITGFRPPWTLELERFRTRDVEVEDTAALRLTVPGGPVITVAVSLCSTDFIPGDITVTGTEGTAVTVYPEDRLDGVVLPGRVGLLENLLDHRDNGTPLLVPLERTEPFTALAAEIVAAAPPVPLSRDRLVPHPDGGGLAIAGIAAHVRAAARGALFSEIGALLNIADLPDGGTPATLAALGAGWGPVVRGGISRYDAVGHRTHAESDRHTHDVPEIFTIVQGAGVLELDGVRETRFTAGDILVIEPGEDHHLISDGAEPLVFTWMHLGATFTAD